jgi:hypothetical protein
MASIRKGKKAVRMIAKDYFEHPNSTNAYSIHRRAFWALVDYQHNLCNALKGVIMGVKRDK